MEVGIEVSAMLGIAATLLTSLLKNKAWSTGFKTVILVGVSVGLTFFSQSIQDLQWNAEVFLANLAVVVSTAVMIYNLLLQKLSLNKKLEDTTIPVISPALDKAERVFPQPDQEE